MLITSAQVNHPSGAERVLISANDPLEANPSPSKIIIRGRCGIFFGTLQFIVKMLQIFELPILLIPLACLCAYLYILNHSRLSIPPGPRPLPVLGNILSIPSRRPWETYAAWAREYKSEHAPSR